ncbi:hypothetical protein FLK61_28035 [Paenalkalicoccus suaedae]|uniref:Uncharacterized protein n=1 Tax=Paenalkalicoccus suaedae TaxID=2592382 RepID=A0A859FCT2_9BACI|nr:hypothetical protein [Paenalkalicoccus suaedae]QKS70601.1 hypothetical protein FLK61_28035 [Paenalkalicoccus suaedae]
MNAKEVDMYLMSVAAFIMRVESLNEREAFNLIRENRVKERLKMVPSLADHCSPKQCAEMLLTNRG